MRRSLILAVAVASLCLTVFVLTFAFSQYWVTKQGFVTSLSDFTFMIDSYVRMAFELPSPPPTERRIESALKRLRPTAHREVKHRIVWWFGQWGEVAVPQLTQAFESADERRKEWLARALGATRSPQAVAPLNRYLTRRSQSEDLSAWRYMKPVRAAAEALGRIGTDEAVRADCIPSAGMPEL